MKKIFWLILLLGACSKEVLFQDYPIGGPFDAMDQDGVDSSFMDVVKRGKPVLLFFGYTTCPDYCPATIGKFRRLEKQFGDKLSYVFVSVDPRRDTPAILKEYASKVPGMIAFTFRREADADRVAGLYGFTPVRGAAKNYTVDHTTRVFLHDREGRVRYMFRFTDAPAVMEGVIDRIL